jgi:hypothetical protein
MNNRTFPGMSAGFVALLAASFAATSVARGGDLPPNCPASGDCDTAHAWPGCNSTVCCNEVCSFDPFCCESQWDAACVQDAEAACPVIPPGVPNNGICGPLNPFGSCFVEHPTPKCDNLVCCEMVSVLDPFCFDVAWDAFCVSAANLVCICESSPCSPRQHRISFGSSPDDSGAVPSCASGSVTLDDNFAQSQGIVFGWATNPFYGGPEGLHSIASDPEFCPDDCRSMSSPVAPFIPDGVWRCEFRVAGPSGGTAQVEGGVTTFSADVGFLQVPVTMVGYGLDGSVVASTTTTEFGTTRMTLTAPPGKLIVHVKVSQPQRRIALDCLSYDGPFDATPKCPNVGHSCFDIGRPGCDDAVCCQQVCITDPSCCAVLWDVPCIVAAIGACTDCTAPSCDVCAAGADNSCFETASPPDPGCSDALCCATVCVVDPFCCTTDWDGVCVTQALALCLTDTDGSDDCSTPTPIAGLGTFPFDTTSATTDGSPSPLCMGSGSDNIDNDVWFCWTAPATGYVEFNVCAVIFNTKIAIYPGCGSPCPTDPIACNDDGDCSSSFHGARMLVEVEEGLSYRIRLGGASGQEGTGELTISMPCVPGGTGDCCEPQRSPGCGDYTCCSLVCFQDDFCCTAIWDSWCVGEASLLPECGCDSGSGCDGATGSCTQIHPGPGCADSACCETVCAAEPSCCESGWDWFCAEAALAACSPLACDTPTVAGATAEVHSAVTDPMQIALGADAALYCGRDAIGSGGSNSTPVKIHRTLPGGGPAAEFGAVAIPDPDAVLVDVAGTLSGVPGSVLVGGQTDASGNTGQILAVRPDQSVVTVFASGTLWKDPQDMVFDGPNLLVADRIRREIRRWMPGQATLSLLVDDLPENPTHIAVDQAGRIFVSLLDGTIRRYNQNGTGEFLVASGLPPQTPIAVGPTGPWQAGDVYAVVGSDLVRFDGDLGGTPVSVGCGFTGTTRDIAFGPDGALYVSRFGNDHVMRFERPNLGAVPGDLDCNGLATVDDVAILCAAVEDPAGHAATYPACPLWATGDLDDDGSITVADVASLCALLAEPSCGCSPPGDLDGDGDVDGADLATLLGAWGSAGPLGDLNDDNTVDAADLAILLGGWGS